MGKRLRLILLMLFCCAVTLTGCSGSQKSYMDGIYEGKSEIDKNDEGSDTDNGYGVVTITIKNNTIADCIFLTYESDGTLKDENYGKEGGEIISRDYYNKAQLAVEACTEYADLLIQNGNLDEVDAISGATINYNEFYEAVYNALEQAEKKD